MSEQIEPTKRQRLVGAQKGRWLTAVDRKQAR
jgi:hypothetical protein